MKKLVAIFLTLTLIFCTTTFLSSCDNEENKQTEQTETIAEGDTGDKNGRDIYSCLANYAMDEGEYSVEEKRYELTIGKNTANSGAIDRRLLYYYAEKDEIELRLFSMDSQSEGMFTLYIDEIDATYEWSFYISGYYMSGTIYANTFGFDNLLEYSFTNITNNPAVTNKSSAISQVRELASAAAKLLAISINIDLEPINVTSADLGFLKM